jgi:hypothetical protein
MIVSARYLQSVHDGELSNDFRCGLTRNGQSETELSGIAAAPTENLAPFVDGQRMYGSARRYDDLVGLERRQLF